MQLYRSLNPRVLELEELSRAFHGLFPLTDEETEVRGGRTHCPPWEPGQDQSGAVRGAAQAFLPWPPNHAL